MWNKNVKKIGTLVLTVIMAASMHLTTAYALPGLSIGLSAGADAVISKSPLVLADSSEQESDTAAKMDETADTKADETNSDKNNADKNSAGQSGTDESNADESESATEETAVEEIDIAADTAPESISFTVGVGNMVASAQQPEGETENAMDEQSDDEEEESGGYYGYTNLGVVQVEDHLNVRETSSPDSNIVGKMEKDAGCEVLEIEGNMAHITSGSVDGYVSLDYLLTGPDAIMRAACVVKEVATVTADRLKLREEPSIDAPVHSVVAYGEELEVAEMIDDWAAVKYDGQTVYVSADYVTVDMKLKTALNMTEFLYGEGVSGVRIELCEYAKQFIGNPYVWGGTSLTKGADCSGFVLSVFAKYGISLPHSSRAQANCGTPVSIADAKPGDLVFYAKGGTINHVGIYIGGGQIVNASSPKTGIRIANVYYRTPVKVVRILQG